GFPPVHRRVPWGYSGIEHLAGVLECRGGAPIALRRVLNSGHSQICLPDLALNTRVVEGACFGSTGGQGLVKDSKRLISIIFGLVGLRQPPVYAPGNIEYTVVLFGNEHPRPRGLLRQDNSNVEGLMLPPAVV